MSMSEKNKMKGMTAHLGLSAWLQAKEGRLLGTSPEENKEVLTDFLTDLGLWWREEYGEWPWFGDYDFPIQGHWAAEVDNYDGP